MVEATILDHTSLASTFTYGNFEQIFLTDRIPSAMISKNSRTARLALFINPRFVKKVAIGHLCKRRWRQSPNTPRKYEFSGNLVNATETRVTEALEKAIYNIVLHEFSHFWFGHLDREIPENERHLANIAHDMLLNYHSNVSLALEELDPMPSDGLTTMYLTMLRSWIVDSYRAGRDMKEIKPLSLIGVEFSKINKPHGVDDNAMYHLWRALQLFRKMGNKKLDNTELWEKLRELVQAVRYYSDTLRGIMERVVELFPQLAPPPPHKGHGKLPTILCGHGTPQPGSQSPESPQQDVPHDKPFEHEGFTFEPVDENSMTPELAFQLPEIISKHAGAGSPLAKTFVETSPMSVKNATAKSLLKHAAVSLVHHAASVLNLRRKPSMTATTSIPNRNPVLSDLARNSCLLLDRDPHYKPVLPQRGKNNLAKVHLFVDVSGSTSEDWPKILGFAVALGKHCELTTYQFSTEVKEVKLADLKGGIIVTTGGTDANCVLEKIRSLSTAATSFIVVGDRHYGRWQEHKPLAKPSVLMDVAISDGKKTPWFQTTHDLEVHWANLNEDFQVIEESD